MSTRIVISDIQEITLSTQFIEFEAPNGKVIIDIKNLLISNGDEAYFNATQVAKLFAKNNKKAYLLVRNYLKSKKTREYISILEEAVNKNNPTQKGTIKIRFTRRGFTEKDSWKNGTWFYKDLAIDFFRFLDTRFAVMCDQFLKQVITQSYVLYIEREQTKILFKPLTDTIKNIWIPRQKTKNKKKWAYKLLMDLANLSALGVSSQKYKKDNNIEVEKGKTIRDYMSKDELKKIEEAERQINGFIEFGNIYDYEELKAKLCVK
jgi:hypothetical protein